MQYNILEVDEITMEQFLKPTKFCDCDNKKIIEKEIKLIKNDDYTKEEELSILHFGLFAFTHWK